MKFNPRCSANGGNPDRLTMEVHTTITERDSRAKKHLYLRLEQWPDERRFDGSSCAIPRVQLRQSLQFHGGLARRAYIKWGHNSQRRSVPAMLSASGAAEGELLGGGFPAALSSFGLIEPRTTSISAVAWTPPPSPSNVSDCTPLIWIGYGFLLISSPLLFDRCAMCHRFGRGRIDVRTQFLTRNARDALDFDNFFVRYTTRFNPLLYGLRSHIHGARK